MLTLDDRIKLHMISCDFSVMALMGLKLANDAIRGMQTGQCTLEEHIKTMQTAWPHTNIKGQLLSPASFAIKLTGKRYGIVIVCDSFYNVYEVRALQVVMNGLFQVWIGHLCKKVTKKMHAPQWVGPQGASNDFKMVVVRGMKDGLVRAVKTFSACPRVLECQMVGATELTFGFPATREDALDLEAMDPAFGVLMNDACTLELNI